MKTAVSIPDDVFREAERAAKTLRISRSELFARALREFLEARSGDAIKESYDRAFGSETADDAEALLREAARRRLLDVEW
ncbi:MAG: ribbon-helix-helix protein, CopG family [Deltaproteobacteria bacterium]|nr:ribbon-helix-helix protein, CopG family [Deltaproteobacteria bacterium]